MSCAPCWRSSQRQLQQRPEIQASNALLKALVGRGCLLKEDHHTGMH